MSIKDRLKDIDEGYIRREADKIGTHEVDKVVEEGERIEAKVGAMDLLRKLGDQVRLLVALVRDYRSGAYRAVPYRAVAAIVFALLYVLTPFDLIPDFIPVLGQLDDLAVVNLLLYMVHEELETYRRWREGQKAANL